MKSFCSHFFHPYLSLKVTHIGTLAAIGFLWWLKPTMPWTLIAKIATLKTSEIKGGNPFYKRKWYKPTAYRYNMGSLNVLCNLIQDLLSKSWSVLPFHKSIRSHARIIQKCKGGCVSICVCVCACMYVHVSVGISHT